MVQREKRTKSCTYKSNAVVYLCAYFHDSNTPPYWEYHGCGPALQRLSLRHISQLWHSCSSSISRQRKDGVEPEKWCDTVLGIHNVSTMKETQKAGANDKVKFFSVLPRWTCVCLRDTQQRPRIAQPFLLEFISESCFPMPRATNYSVDVHLSLFYCFEQLQYRFLIPQAMFQTQTQMCMCLHMHKCYIIFHSHSTIARSPSQPNFTPCILHGFHSAVAPYCYMKLSRANA